MPDNIIANHAQTLQRKHDMYNYKAQIKSV